VVDVKPGRVGDSGLELDQAVAFVAFEGGGGPSGVGQQSAHVHGEPVVG
jgi:hypothetical protein